MEDDMTITQKDMACESSVIKDQTACSEAEIDYNFGHKDFGYPRTLEEMKDALDMADAERDDPSKWITAVEFHNRLEQKYPWLR